MNEKEILEKINALNGRKEYLFQELTRINDASKSRLSEIDADIYLRSCTRIESTFERLTEEIIGFNAKLEKGSRINTKDFSVIQTLIDAVVKNCLQAKAKAVSEAKAETREAPSLPALSLPIWDGDIATWMEFKTQFDSLVHDSRRLSETIKLQYLRSTLRGEPLSIVSQYPLTNDSYELAYQELIARYDNKRRIVSYYVDKILTYKVPPPSSGKEHINFIEIHRAASSALTRLGIPDLAGYLLFELSYRNLSTKDQRQFDLEQNTASIPEIKDLLSFIEKIARSEELKLDKESLKSSVSKKSLLISKQSYSCFACKGDHMIYCCPKILSLTIKERRAKVKELGCCVACLYKHSNKCRSKHSCKICGSKEHNTILHEESSPPPSPLESPSRKKIPAAKTCSSCLTTEIKSPVLLGTIECQTQDIWGKSLRVRAVLDSGSEISVITSALADRLGVQISLGNCHVEGIGLSVCKSLGNVRLKISSVKSGESYEFEAVVLPKICHQLPRIKLPSALKKKFDSIELADPNFCDPGRVQILLGADAYAELLSIEEPTIIPGNPTAIRTKFGYVITGRTENTSTDSSKAVTSLSISVTSLNENLRRFWEVEEPRQEIPPDPADAICEQHFRQTHQRDSSGRFVVKLPFIPYAPPLGSNEGTAMKRLENLQRRFKKNPSLETAYTNCLQEYIHMGHISIFQGSTSYLLPHHAVLKEASSTTKCRVVFDCSSQDNYGMSLNDRLYRGPPLLNDILLLLLNFRFFKVCLAADIKMMYRMVLIHPEDRRNLVFSWNSQRYQMNRLPFGLKPAGYIAGRCLMQLADLYNDEFPVAAEAIRKHRYADDFCTGSNTLEESIQLRDQLTCLLAKGGFEIRRWSSNVPEALSGIPEAFREIPTKLPTGETGIKVLGVMWDQTQDAFVARVVKFDSEIISKRSVLSYIARIYDALGFFSPTVFLAKHFMQRLWLMQVDWDQPLVPEFANEWKKYAEELLGLSEIKIPRLLPIGSATVRLVGFSDASEKGMAAAVYIHWRDENSLGQSRLVMAKTKLAPLKTLTIPRLELCAALLLAKIVKPIIEFSERQFETVNLYTDSTVVLAWLNHPLHELKIFISNRVAEIRHMVPSATWNHVTGSQNPADLGSRGVSSENLKESALWWNGPDFLTQPYHKWPNHSPDFWAIDQLPETKNPLILNAQVSEAKDEIIRRFSSLTTMNRVLAYVLRFSNKTRKKDTTSRIYGPLTTSELENALLTAVRLSQLESFESEIKKIKEGKPLSKNLRKVSPFFDQQNQVVRVGGRLSRASFLPENTRHPLLLSSKNHLATLICDHYHKLLLHSGPRTTCAAIQKKFWIFSLMSLVKKRIHRCLTCHRQTSKPQQPVMADVIPGRLEQTFCWAHCAIDFGGPFSTKESKIRKGTIHKSYLCAFVCLTTRAIHLEMVTDLTTDAFLAAFYRFTARRSVPDTIYSDRGTNFVGARGILKECKSFLLKNHDKFFTAAAAVETRWLLNAPYAPNFNGCAENGIKSAKTLIKRQVGDQILTYEEFSTLLCRVEQVLNSRPISFSSLDVKDRDVVYLTPGHFIVGREMMTPPEKLKQESLTPRDRWRRVQHMSQMFWKTWSTAYLHELMQREKWNKVKKNVKVDDIVYVTGIGTSPLSWPIGRVLETFTNSEDSTVRVARIRVRGRDIIRPINKLVVIPTEQ